MEHASGTAASVRLDVGRPDHLAPLLGVFDNELAKIHNCHRRWNAAHLGKSRHHLGIAEASINFLMELVDDIGRREPRRG